MLSVSSVSGAHVQRRTGLIRQLVPPALLHVIKSQFLVLTEEVLHAPGGDPGARGVFKKVAKAPFQTAIAFMVGKVAF